MPSGVEDQVNSTDQAGYQHTSFLDLDEDFLIPDWREKT